MKWKYQSLLMFSSRQICLADKLNIFEIENQSLLMLINKYVSCMYEHSYGIKELTIVTNDHFNYSLMSFYRENVICVGSTHDNMNVPKCRVDHKIGNMKKPQSLLPILGMLGMS